MAELDFALNELEDTIETTRRNYPSAGNKRVQMIIESRRAMIEQVGKIMTAASSDEKLKGAPAVAKQFEQKLTAVRHMIAGYQSKWRIADVSDRLAEHEAHGRSMAADCLDLVKWAKTVRAGL